MDFSRKGYIEIPKRLIREEPELVRLVLSKMLITDVDHDYLRGLIVYGGYSEEFDPVPEGEMPPYYRAVAERNGNETFVKFEKFYKFS